MKRLIVVVGLLVGCTSNTAPAPAVTAKVSCGAPAYLLVDQQTGFADCTISAPGCDDGSTYVLACSSATQNTFTTCQCAVDGVVGGGDVVSLTGTSCQTAGSVTPKQIERAWLDCGVELTFH